MVEKSDKHLINQCLNGHIEAFEGLIDKYQKPIFNLVYRMVQDYEDAKDVTQTIFIKVFEKLKYYNPKFKFFSWLYRMAVNETINFINQKKSHEEVGAMLISKEKTPEEQFERYELLEMVNKALMQLNLDYRTIIILKHFEGFSYEEISYILDIPVKTVKSRLYTARQLLRNLLIKQGLVNQ